MRDVSRCVISAVHHALQHEVCLQLSSLQASHMHAVQGCLRQAYCGSVQAVPICCAECLVACLHALFQKRSFGQERVISILLAKSWLARPEPARAMYALQHCLLPEMPARHLPVESVPARTVC